MDALMAALVAAALAQTGDKTPRLAALLAGRFGRPAIVIVAAALALALNYLTASVLGGLVAPRLTPSAAQLLLGLSLVLAGGGMVVAPKTPDRLAGWRIGAFLTALLGVLILAFGDATQFIVFALAARSPLPWAAGVGATLGALAVVAPAALLGEAAWRALPLGWARPAAAAMLLVTGLGLALGAVGLI